MFSPISSDHFEKPKTEFKPGPAPQLLWIEIKDLVIDPSYAEFDRYRGSQLGRFMGSQPNYLQGPLSDFGN